MKKGLAGLRDFDVQRGAPSHNDSKVLVLRAFSRGAKESVTAFRACEVVGEPETDRDYHL